MISGLMGYLAIATFVLARSMVANQGSQITGAFSGAISGLGLSAFAVRSAAQGKIETPLGSVGPDGVQSYSHIADKINKMSPVGVGESIGAGGNGVWHAKMNNGAYMGADYEALEGRATGTLGKDGGRTVTTASANNGVNGNMGDMLSSNMQVARNKINSAVKTAQTTFNNMHSEGGAFKFGAGQHFKSAETYGEITEKAKQMSLQDIQAGNVTKSIENAKTYQEAAAAYASLGVSIFGNGAGIKGEINKANADKEALLRSYSEATQAMQSRTEAHKKTHSNQNSEEWQQANAWENTIQDIQNTTRSYSDAVQAQEQFSKMESFMKTHSGSISQNMDTLIAQDLVNKAINEGRGAMAGMEDFGKLAATPAAYKAAVQNYLKAAFNGDRSKLEALYNATEGKATAGLNKGFSAANANIGGGAIADFNAGLMSRVLGNQIDISSKEAPATELTGPKGKEQAAAASQGADEIKEDQVKPILKSKGPWKKADPRDNLSASEKALYDKM